VFDSLYLSLLEIHSSFWHNIFMATARREFTVRHYSTWNIWDTCFIVKSSQKIKTNTFKSHSWYRMTYECNVAFTNIFVKYPAHQNFRYTNDLVYIEIGLGVPSLWGPISYGLECFFVDVPLCGLFDSCSVCFNINNSALIPYQFFQSGVHWPVVAHSY
jgi:hypothetical protein